MNDPIWNEPNRRVFDLHHSALIESSEEIGLEKYLGEGPVGPGERVTVVKHEPLRVELKVSLDSPGLVILADTYYPGWRLTIDGNATPILRANRMMRGAVVPAGLHTLVYTYEPKSFLLGGVLSLAGLVGLAWLGRAPRWLAPA